MKTWMKLALAAAGLSVIVLVTIPFLIDANTFRPMVERQLTTALARPVKLGDLRFSLITGGLVAQDLSIADDADFSTMPLLTARQLRIGVEIMPLIFSRQVKVRSFAVVAPHVNLVREANGTWNFSGIGRSAPGRTENGSRTEDARQNSEIPNLTAGLITIEDGRVVVETLPVAGPPRLFERVNLSVRQFSLATKFSFSLSANLPGDAKVTVSGNVGPLNRQDAAATAFDAQVSMKHLDPVAAGVLDPSVGISMVADIEAYAISDGRTLASNGTIHMDHLQLRKGGRPTPNAVELSYIASQGLRDKTGQIQNAMLNTGNVGIHLSGTYELRSVNPLLNLKITGQKMSIDELQGLLSAAGVKLPSEAALKGGTLDIALALTGLANALVITGPVELNNTRVVDFDPGPQIRGIAALRGISTADTTRIEKLRLNLRVTNASIQVDNIDVRIPAIGEFTGGGTMMPRGSPTANTVDLNYIVSPGPRDSVGQAQKATADTGNVAIHLSGLYEPTEHPLLNLKMTGQKMPIDELQALMTAAGVKLPNGATLKGGTLDIALAVIGPANAPVVTGPIELNNTKLVGFDLGSRIRGIAALGGVTTGNMTSIEKLRLNLQITNGGTQVDDLYARIPAMGELAGSGTVSPASVLDFGLTVKVTTARGVGKVGVGLLTHLNRSAGPAENSGVSKGVPMLVTGTANEPVITADVRGLLHRGNKTSHAGSRNEK